MVNNLQILFLKQLVLDYVNAIVDEQSVMSQGMATEEKLTPEAIRELDKLVDPQLFL